MKKFVKDVLIGILVVIVVIIFEFIVTIPFGLPSEGIDRESWRKIMSREFLVTAVPAGLTTFVFALLLKTGTRADAIRRAVIWTLLLGLNYFLMGIGNDNLDLIYGNIGIVALLACAFLGPVAVIVIKKLK
ncbi:hypothetical protein [Anaerobium acetethylicum]|uniref:Osmoprotectant transport system permease protein n=1 Tax=Anaerobium acetethylicum TaxID=1619234 RepID=A0A1D3TY77_9FIRM|nr:hypothetical protein [Anaerobium acetethylicum]SCP99380.1 hypothetical protein SAMN05421730_103926 [Anaerobium acetethylicum]